MPSRFKEGDKVKIVSRPVNDDDRKSGRYYDHMAGLSGIVQNVYGSEEIAVKVDKVGLPETPRSVHKVAVERMREKFLGSIGEEQKKSLSSDELNFEAHYMLLVRAADLEKA